MPHTYKGKYPNRIESAWRSVDGSFECRLNNGRIYKMRVLPGVHKVHSLSDVVGLEVMPNCETDSICLASAYVELTFDRQSDKRIAK